MKRTTILMALMALMVALVTGTAAAKQNGKGKVTYNFKGTLMEVDADEPEIDGDGTYVVVDVTGGNKRARSHLGSQMFAVTLGETKVEINEEDADLSELVVGDEVKVQSKAAKDAQQFDAGKISVEREGETSPE